MTNSSPSPLVIVGAGGLGREVASLIETQPDSPWRLLGFVDDRAPDKTIEGWPVLGVIEDIYRMQPTPWAAIAIADSKIRQRLFLEFKQNNIPIATLVHPSATLSRHVVIGEGSIICADAIITTNVTLGRACIVNPGDFIGHDTVLKDWVSLMPRVAVAGEVVLGEGAYLGINSCVINRTAVGEWSVIGAGATVAKAIPPHSLAVGVPARVIKSL